MKKKILITGGAGFIGLHLTEGLLAKGYQVDVLDNFARAVSDSDLERVLKNEDAKLIECDLLDKDAIQKLDKDYFVIFHLAAIIGVANVLERPYDVLVANTELLVNMLEFAKQQLDLQRFVFASTSEIYAGTLKHFDLAIPTPEDTPLAVTDLSHPRTSYMLSKIYGEALCNQSGVPFTIVRPHNIYGPRMGMSHVIPELCKKARSITQNGELEVYSVDHKRTFCYVSDAVEELIRMIETEKCVDQTLNLGNQSPEIEIGYLAKVILKVIDREDLSLKAMPATSGSPTRRGPDMSKTNTLTEFEAHVGIEEGAAKTYAWYISNIFEGHGVTAK